MFRSCFLDLNIKLNKKNTNNTNNNIIINMSEQILIKNKGSGAGGSNTNKNGLNYEQMTDLNTEFKTIQEGRYWKIIEFTDESGKTKRYKRACQSNFKKSMMHFNMIDTSVPEGHGCKKPDECYIDYANLAIYIIEKKFQQVNGSVCEKIQTADFKLWQYRRTFPKFKIHYIYCLSDWFKHNCKAELQYLKEKKVPVFWGNDKEYKTKIKKFILNN